MSHHIQRVAHRGGSHLAPENTLAAFRNALTLPIDAIEFDVHMTRDGQAIVFHDNIIERSTNGKGNILDLDYAYLSSLNAAHFHGDRAEHHSIPTLREALDLIKGRVRAFIEIKRSRRDEEYGRYPSIVETVAAEVRDAGMIDQVLIISYDWMILPLVKALEPTVETGAIVSTKVWDPTPDHALDILVQQLAALDCQWMNMKIDLYTDAVVPTAHDHALKLGLWTVNSEPEMRRFAAAGVDALISDRPDLFAKLLG